MDAADALLCEWAPDEELFTFAGPRTWYNSEAVWRRLFDTPPWAAVRDSRDERLFIYHAHSNPAFRVPMICFVEPLRHLDAGGRLPKAVAVISNSGATWQTPDILRRTALALHPSVDLFGNRQSWEQLAKRRGLADALPANYRGEIGGSWTSPEKFEVMSRYHAAICLENVTEPYYFTEKFHAAAQAGCIPIYHSHPTVRDTTLRGARWIDPAVFAWDPDATLAFALGQPRRVYADANFRWLASAQAQATGLAQVFQRLGEILRDGATNPP